RSVQPRDAVEQARFARAVRPDDGVDAPLLHGEADALERLDAAEAQSDVGDLEQGLPGADRAPVQREPGLALDHTRSLREMPASRDGWRFKAAVVFSMWNTMAAKKFAISVPEDVMAEIDRAAASRGVTRSRFIAQILALAARQRRDRAITRALDRVF